MYPINGKKSILLSAVIIFTTSLMTIACETSGSKSKKNRAQPKVANEFTGDQAPGQKEELANAANTNTAANQESGTIYNNGEPKQESDDTASNCINLDTAKKLGQDGENEDSPSQSSSKALFDNISFLGFCVNSDTADKALAEKGLQYIYQGKPFIGAGLPLSTAQVLKEVLAQAPKSELAQIDTTTLEGSYRVFGTLPSPKSRPAAQLGPQSIPVEKMGDTIYLYKTSPVSGSNCFGCHSGMVDGKVISGVMNTAIDQAAQRVSMLGLLQLAPTLAQANQAAVDAGKPTAPLDSVVFNSYINRLSSNLELVYRSAEAKGDNLGPFAVWRSISRYGGEGINEIPVSQETELDELWTDVKLPTVDANPWWHYKYKNSIYRYADKTADFASHFSFTFSQPTPEANSHRQEQYDVLTAVLSYIDQIKSPKYEGKVDADLAAEGEALFHGKKALASGTTLTCTACHGKYKNDQNGYQVEYTEKGIIDVGTDTAYTDFLMDVTQKITDVRKPQLADFFKDTPKLVPDWEVPQAQGYEAPPLDGVWASAPYFHNGSVPTIYDVLNSATRPALWSRSAQTDFDHQKVGLANQEITPAVYEAAGTAAVTSHPFSEEAVKFRGIYNTQNHGKGHQGHTFGDAMTDAERFAVIEFLKTLGG